jgi:hypothetical protein
MIFTRYSSFTAMQWRKTVDRIILVAILEEYQYLFSHLLFVTRHSCRFRCKLLLIWPVSL